MNRTLTGSRYLAEAVAEHGITHVFMVPTVAVRALAEMDDLGVTGVMAHGEKAAAYMADGYARARRGPGICLAQGIGAANLAAGLRDAKMAHSPVIALTGGLSPATRDRGVYQEIEDFPLYVPLTKYNMQLDDVARLPDMLRQIFRTATTSAPGPVHLELQGTVASILDRELNLSDAEQGFVTESRFGSVPPFRPVADAESIRAAVELIRTAQRPVIVAGNGARWSGAGAALLRAAQALDVPVATSLAGKGLLDERGPYAVGVMGASSRKSANQTLERADLVLLVGTTAGSQMTDGWRLPAAGTTVIQLDLDPAQLGRNYPNTVSLQGDAAATLDALAAAAEPRLDHSEWIAETAGYVADWRREDEHLLASTDAPTRPERLCREITEFLPDDGVLVVDTGHSGMWAASSIDLRPSQTLIRASGSLGWALPASIGAKAAVGDRTVVCFTGDGGFYYHLSEVETAVRHGLNPIIVVNNNQSLSQDMKIFQSSWGGADKISDAGDRMWRFGSVDLARVAAELGAFSLRVDDPADLPDALKQAAAAGRPAVLDVRTDADALPAIPHGGRDFYAPVEQ
jgi:acetolactate synthase-1/2/3 large subunit